MSASPAGLTVVKVGGGLSAIPGALDAVAAALAAAGRQRRLLVVPGGGPFADSVRRFAGAAPLSDDAAHWMAILGMDQYAHVWRGALRPADYTAPTSDRRAVSREAAGERLARVVCG
ncbi:MAG TPA: hypothetical protein VFN08_21210, partial [Gemmatimonadales bacterium]|nr:hypothetical protein [Gemmatimonadales bacterium]